MNETEKHLRAVKRQLYKNLFKAYAGWWEWRKIKKIKGFGNTAVVLLPSCEREINHLALLYLDDMLRSRKHDNAVILTHDPEALKAARLYSDRIIKVVDFSRKKAERIMQFYCLYEFNKKFIVASLDEPYGRNGSALIGKKGTTKEEVFVIGVYRIYPFERPDEPAYAGEDEDIRRFIGCRVG
ncbi:MAG: hypothetical protein NC337_06985 [Roseburia sp.]|nr:hypothetical protein [Roseburia sp.]